jgi:gallate decarboxylase subunit D
MTDNSSSTEGSCIHVCSHIISEKQNGFEVTAVVYELSEDCLVILYGGTRPHIGAIGMSQIRPSLKDPKQNSATSSVFTYTGHKEDVLAKALSEELSIRLGRNTVVVAGIHWDGLSVENIEKIRSICRIITEKIVKELSENIP